MKKKTYYHKKKKTFAREHFTLLFLVILLYIIYIINLINGLNLEPDYCRSLHRTADDSYATIACVIVVHRELQSPPTSRRYIYSFSIDQQAAHAACIRLYRVAMRNIRNWK